MVFIRFTKLRTWGSTCCTIRDNNYRKNPTRFHWSKRPVDTTAFDSHDPSSNSSSNNDDRRREKMTDAWWRTDSRRPMRRAVVGDKDEPQLLASTGERRHWHGHTRGHNAHSRRISHNAENPPNRTHSTTRYINDNSKWKTSAIATSLRSPTGEQKPSVNNSVNIGCGLRAYREDVKLSWIAFPDRWNRWRRTLVVISRTRHPQHGGGISTATSYITEPLLLQRQQQQH